MADQRSVMKEYRLLEQKLQGGGLSPQEEARFAQLRDLVGSDSGVGGSRPGFDVNAAAARLRESLLPAGLRNRPASMPEPPPPEPEPVPEPPAEEAGGLEAVWNAAPFAPLTEREGLSAEALFDPGTLGSDAPPPAAEWDPNAQPYDAGAQAWDAGAQPYDPNAPQQWDASGQPWDPNAQPYDPNAQPYDAGAQAWDAGAQPYDPNAPQQWDASGQPWDPNAQPYDPNAQPYDVGGAASWGEAAPGEAAPEAAAEAAPDPAWAAGSEVEGAEPMADAAWSEAAPEEGAAEATAEAAPDAAWTAGSEVEGTEPMAEPAWGEAPPAEAGPEAGPDAAWAAGSEVEAAEPMAEAEQGAALEAGFDAGEPAALFGSEPGGVLAPEPPAEEAQPWEAEAAEPPTAAWDASALPPEEQPPEVAWAAEPAAEPIAEPGPVSPLDFGSEEAPAPLGEEGAVPFASAPEPAEGEPTAAAEPLEQPVAPAEEALAIEMGDLAAPTPPPTPPGWGAEEPSFDVDVSEPPVLASAADYGDLSPEQPAQVDALPREDAHGLLAPLAAGQELTSDDDAFAQGFQLASNGSFGSAAAPSAPAWSAKPGPEGSEDWESAPSLDLDAMSAAGSVPPLDLGLPPSGAPPAGPPAPGAYDGLEELEVEEIPMVEGSDALEELPPGPAPRVAAAAPPPPPTAAKPPPPPAAAKPASETGALRVAGSHRVVVHTVEGLVKRGVIADVSLDAPTLPLAAQPDAPPESLPVSKVKAIFFMLAAGETPPAAEGKKVRVTFNDGRQIAGFSPDYTDAGTGFFMIPADTRTNTGRIWVYRSAVKSVSVS